MRRFLILTAPAAVLASLLSALVVEIWVRANWDDQRGTPGFYLSDPVLGQRLAPGYDGWFAGVPVRINALGFRDEREYSIEKPPGTFRILVLGDSVTFGHGTLNTTTYPFLLEQRLKAWRPDVTWEVWNLGVPGYNTSQELAYLKRVGARYAPDLVVVGFYGNDLQDNAPATEPGLVRRAASAVQRSMQRSFYSYELYKRVVLTVRWQLLTRTADRQRLEQLAGEEQLLVPQADAAFGAMQALTGVERLADQQVRGFVCAEFSGRRSLGEGGTNRQDRDRLAHTLQADSPEMARWTAAVRGLQQIDRDGVHPVVFFINMAPDLCADEDRFYDGGALEDDDALRAILGQGTKVSSSVRAYLHYRPSQMPGARGHSMGNANVVKADALFDFLRADVLPGRLPQAQP